MADESALPPYVERPTGYDLALGGPYLQQGVNLRAYVLRSNADALQQTCDRYLNQPGSRYTYSPLYPAVVLTMVNLTKVSAGDASLGYMHEIDAAFQFLTLRRERTNPFSFGIAAFSPYLWVNNDWAMVTGRESVGFRKEIGSSFTDLQSDELAQSAADLSHVDAWVVPARGAKLGVRRLVEIDPASLATKPGSEFATPHDLLDFVLKKAIGGGLAGALDAIAALGELKVPGSLDLPMVFLKQMRDAFDPTKACYQAVFQSISKIPFAGFSGGLLPGTHRVAIHDCVSHPLVQELGFSLDAEDGLAASVAFELNFDTQFELPVSA